MDGLNCYFDGLLYGRPIPGKRLPLSIVDMLPDYGEAVEFRDWIRRTGDAAYVSLLDEYEQICRDLEDELAVELAPSSIRQASDSQWRGLWLRVKSEAVKA